VNVDRDQDDPTHALRAAVLKLRAPEVSKRAPAPTSSVYGRAAAAVPADVRPPADREALSSRYRNIETSALMSGTTMALLVYPDDGDLPRDVLRSLELLVASRAQVVVLGSAVGRVIEAGKVRTIPLRQDDALHHEWALLALGPTKRVAFLARSRPDDTWDWMITRDAVAVHRAGTAILERVPFLRLRVPALDD
jgi:hypothetical protein